MTAPVVAPLRVDHHARVLVRKVVAEAWRFRLATAIVPVLAGWFLVSVFSRTFQEVIASALGLDGAAYRSLTIGGCVLAAAMMGANTSGISLAIERQTGFSKRLRLLGAYGQALWIRRLVDGLRLGLVGLVILAYGWVDGVESQLWPATIAVVFVVAALWGAAFGSFAIMACVPKSSPELSQTVVPLLFPFGLISSAFVPQEWLPSTLEWIARINPVTYGVDAVRATQSGTMPWGDLGVIAGVSVLLIVLGSLVVRNVDAS